MIQARDPIERIDSSSHIPYLRAGLFEAADRLKQVSVEIDGFRGYNPEEIASLRGALVSQFQHMRDYINGDFDVFIQTQLGAKLQLETAIFERYFGRFIASAVQIITLSAALSEALINSLVAICLVAHRKSELFALFDRMKLLEKWQLGPKLFDDEFAIDLGNHLFGRLKSLEKLRNALMHSKPDINSSEPTHSIRGTSRNTISMDKRSRMLLLDYAVLPDELFDLVVSGIRSSDYESLIKSAAYRSILS